MDDTQTQTVDQQIPQETTQSTAPSEPRWFESLPDHLKTNPNITKYNTLESFAEWQTNASKLIGKKVQELSADEIRNFMTPEDLAGVMSSKGLPTSVDEYRLPTMEEHLDPGLAKTIKEKAFNLGVTPEQTEEMLKFQTEHQMQVAEKARTDWANQSLDKFGKDLHDVLKVAKSAINEFGSQDLIKHLDDTGLGNHPMVIEMFHKIGQQMQQDHLPHPGSHDSSGASSVKDQIHDLMKDSKFMNQWRNRERHAVEKLDGLYATLNKLEGKG
jgi:hypothetical protein